MDFEKEIKELRLIENTFTKIHQGIMHLSEHKNNLDEEDLRNLKKFEDATHIYLNVYIRMYEDFKKFEKAIRKNNHASEQAIESQINLVREYFNLLQKKELQHIDKFNELYEKIISRNRFIKQEFEMLAELEAVRYRQGNYSNAA